MIKKKLNLLFVVLFCFFIPTKSFAIEDTIIAVVNEDVITMHDLRDYINSLASQMRLEGADPQRLNEFMNEMAESGLDRLINDRLLLNTAIKKEIPASDDEIDAKLEGITAQYRSEEDFLKALLDEGVSVSDIRKKIANQIKVKRLIDIEIRSKIYVNPQEVNEYFKQHFEEFQRPERVNLDSIFIAKDNNKETAHKKIEEALAKIKKGESFKDVAKEYSQGAPIGVMKKGQVLPEIENVVFALEEGSVSDICEVENGYYIFKLLGRSKQDLAELDEVKDQIYSRIFQAKYQEKFGIWLEKLKKEAFIDIKRQL